jgi:UDP-N-acetylmuramate dehydrogenase
VGGAQVSEKHAGFIINRGGATARDVLALTEIVRAEVLRQFGKEIECEIRVIGN